VDVAMIWADSSFCTDYNDMTYCLVKVGEALETQGRFIDAARVYDDVSSKLAEVNGLSNESGREEWITLEYAGLAYNQFAAADKSYIAALYSDCYVQCNGGRSWTVNGTATSDIFEKVILCHEHIYHHPDDAIVQAHTNNYPLQSLAYVAILGLLYAAGYTPHLPIQNEFRQAASAVTALKEQYTRSPESATVALKVALHGRPSVQDFHVRLVRYLVDGSKTELQIVLPLKKEARANLAAAQKLAKQLARMEKEHDVPLVGSYACSSPECRGMHSAQTLKYCPCQKVRYCSKDCQRTHWRLHKKVCPAVVAVERSRTSRNIYIYLYKEGELCTSI
jgi:MYND finger